MSALDCDLIQSVIEHMNEDHAAAVLLYVQIQAGVRDASDARLQDIDSQGMNISYLGEGSRAEVRVPFTRTVSSADEIRSELIRMAKEARELSNQ